MPSKSRDEKFQVARKLHCQFGHVSASKLQKIVKASSINDDELLKLLVEIKITVKNALDISNQV